MFITFLSKYLSGFQLDVETPLLGNEKDSKSKDKNISKDTQESVKEEELPTETSPTPAGNVDLLQLFIDNKQETYYVLVEIISNLFSVVYVSNFHPSHKIQSVLIISGKLLLLGIII